MSVRPIFLLAVLLCLFTPFILSARAQVAPTPDAPPTAEPTVPATASSAGPVAKSPAPAPTAVPATTPSALPARSRLPATAHFRAIANLVDLYFVARGPDKKLVANLARNDCTLDEDNTPQTIETFTTQTGQPLTLGILLDTSLSQQRVLATERQVADAFLRSLLRPRDEAFVLGFDVDVTLLADFTSSPGTLERAIDRTHINSSSGNYANGTVPPIGKPKGTLLYDAVYLAANRKLRQEAGRKALVLLTDGVDEGSQTSLQSALEAAQKANAIVYILLIQDPGLYGVTENLDAGPMRKLARATGGQVFTVGSNGRKMGAAFTAIENELRTQYQLTYTPSNKTRDGTYRSVQITCRQQGRRLHVLARQGYYAEPPAHFDSSVQ